MMPGKQVTLFNIVQIFLVIAISMGLLWVQG